MVVFFLELESVYKSNRMFGSWIHDTSVICSLRDQYHNAQPYPHVVVESFLDDVIAQAVYSEFPIHSDPSRWIVYNNPIEHKKACNNFTGCPTIQRVFEALQSDMFVAVLKEITGITNLENDEHLHGAGLHFHENGGHLDMHLDYDIHPVTHKQRRVNVILFLNPEWNAEAYNGELELWDAEFTHAVRKIAPLWNRMVIFRTDDISWHGLPTPLTLPESVDGRRSLAIYYVSEPTTAAAEMPRHKAKFRPLPNQQVDSKLLNLYEIRSKRTIFPGDLIDFL